MNGILSAMGLSPEASKLLLEQQQKQQSPQKTVQLPLQLAPPNTQQASNGSASSIPQVTLTAVPKTLSSATSVSSNNEHGETDEASSGVTSVNGWRGPAPYRCGHCHQASNWKHVIQVSY